MKPHYFNQDRPDQDDFILTMVKDQGYVPLGCLLGGQVVYGLTAKGVDPCIGCEGPRARCKGRRKEEPTTTLGSILRGI